MTIRDAHHHYHHDYRPFRRNDKLSIPLANENKILIRKQDVFLLFTIITMKKI